MPYASLDLSGKTVLITGASAGIGEKIAHRFAELNCNLVLVARRKERLEALKAELNKIAPKVTIQVCVCDISDSTKCSKLVEEVTGDVDILINNAGFALGTPKADEAPLEDTIAMMNTNVIAVMHLVSLFVPGMRKRAFGHVVNISSVAGHETYEGGAVYCATKHAVNAFTIATRMDLVDTPVRVTAISPGIVETEFSMVRFKGDQDKAKVPYQNILPLHAEDVADQVIYACTRPRHVQIADIISYCTNQGHAKYVVAREGEDMGASKYQNN